jgi:DNA-binding IclR family transcriptional regulator
VVAALSVSGPSFRLDGTRLEQEVAPAGLRAADRLSRLLGHSGAALA